ENGFVCEWRNPVLLHENFDTVSHHLEQSERSDAIGAVAVLPQCEQPPLEPDEPGRQGQRNDKDAEDHHYWVRTVAHLDLTIFPHTGKSNPTMGGTPAGRPATPNGKSGRMRTDSWNVDPAQCTSTFSPSVKSPALTATCGTVASSRIPGATRLNSSEPKM